MKKILLMLLSIILLSCGNRKVEIEKSKMLEKTNLNQISESKSNISSHTNESQISSIKEESLVSKENLQTESSKSTSEKSSQKSNYENNYRTEKTTEYYENGNKKSERETSESFSKISQEKDYWKASAESLKKDNEVITRNLAITSTTLYNLKITEKKISEELKKSKSELVKLKKQSDKTSQSTRDSWWLYLLIYILGLATFQGIKIIFKK